MKGSVIRHAAQTLTPPGNYRRDVIAIVDKVSSRRTRFRARLDTGSFAFREFSEIAALATDDSGIDLILICDCADAVAKCFRYLATNDLPVAVCAYAEHAATQNIVAALNSGVFDYFCCKWDQNIDTRLAQAIGAGSDQAAKVADIYRIKDRMKSLSPREMEVASLMVKGVSNVEIAHELAISSRTVEIHCSNVLFKLGLDRKRCCYLADAFENC